MSRITQRSSVAPLGMFSQATSSSAGTGTVDASFATYTGQKFDTADGRELTLVSVGATAITSGLLVSGVAATATHQGLAVAVPAATPATAGTYKVSVTLGASVLNQNSYQGGFLIVVAGTGIGQTLKIASNPGAASSAAGVIITLEDAIITTLDATSVVNLIPNPYNNVVVENHTTLPGAVLGVTLYPLAASVAPTYNGTTGVKTAAGVQQYGYIVSKGIVSCLSDVTVAAVGLGIMPSATTDGCVTVQTATGRNIGAAYQLGVSAQAQAVYIDC